MTYLPPLWRLYISDKYPNDWKTRRKDVYSRDNYTCQSCGATGGRRGNAELHAHHITSISEGGGHEYSNLTTLCASCHDDKHDHPIYTGGSSSGEGSSSGGGIFKYGIGAFTTDSKSTSTSGDDLFDVDESEDPPFPEDGFAMMFSLGPIMTVGLFAFTLPFWLMLFDGEGVLGGVVFLAGVLVFFLLPWGIMSVFAAISTGAVVGRAIDVFCVGLFAGEVPKEDQHWYILANLIPVLFFHGSLYKAAPAHFDFFLPAVASAAVTGFVSWVIAMGLTTTGLFIKWATVPIDADE